MTNSYALSPTEVTNLLAGSGGGIYTEFTVVELADPVPQEHRITEIYLEVTTVSALDRYRIHIIP